MSQRPGFTISKFREVDGGTSPNEFKPMVTVEIRAHYPTQQKTVAMELLLEAFDDAVKELVGRMVKGDNG